MSFVNEPVQMNDKSRIFALRAVRQLFENRLYLSFQFFHFFCNFLTKCNDYRLLIIIMIMIIIITSMRPSYMNSCVKTCLS